MTFFLFKCNHAEEMFSKDNFVVLSYIVYNVVKFVCITAHNPNNTMTMIGTIPLLLQDKSHFEFRIGYTVYTYHIPRRETGLVYVV